MRPGANSTIFRFGLEDLTPPGISSQKKNVDEKQRKPLLLFLLLGLFLLRTPQPTPGCRAPSGARTCLKLAPYFDYIAISLIAKEVGSLF